MQNFDKEQALVELLKNNESIALTKLYNAYWEPLFVSAYNVLKNKENCEEAVQNVFIGIWKNRAQLKINTSLKSYLYACTRYQVFHQIKKNKREQQAKLFQGLEKRFDYNSPETELSYKELLEQIDIVVANLPEKCQEVYLLSRKEQLSHKKISKHLNISTKTVENHITKALRILRASIKSVYFLFF